MEGSWALCLEFKEEVVGKFLDARISTLQIQVLGLSLLDLLKTKNVFKALALKFDLIFIIFEELNSLRHSEWSSVFFDRN